MERNPFSAKNQTLRSYRIYISPTKASSALIQIELLIQIESLIEIEAPIQIVPQKPNFIVIHDGMQTVFMK